MIQTVAFDRSHTATCGTDDVTEAKCTSILF
jgi:hypothetical protein